MVLEREDQQLGEMHWHGDVQAMFPMLNGLLADRKEPGQFSLGQVHVLAQRHTGAPEGLLLHVVIGIRMLHLLSSPGAKERRSSDTSLHSG